MRTKVPQSITQRHERAKAGHRYACSLGRAELRANAAATSSQPSPAQPVVAKSSAHLQIENTHTTNIPNARCTRRPLSTTAYRQAWAPGLPGLQGLDSGTQSPGPGKTASQHNLETNPIGQPTLLLFASQQRPIPVCIAMHLSYTHPVTTAGLHEMTATNTQRNTTCPSVATNPTVEATLWLHIMHMAT